MASAKTHGSEVPKQSKSAVELETAISEDMSYRKACQKIEQLTGERISHSLLAKYARGEVVPPKHGNRRTVLKQVLGVSTTGWEIFVY